MARNRSFYRREVSPRAKRAALYIRVSTDDQKCSIEVQTDIMAAYAACHGLIIVKIYIDYAKSGLRLDGRPELKKLIQDVRFGQAYFGTILVYDVSRWGRFQDADESAHYEFVCKRAGVRIQYCAEQFDNNGSMVATLLKGLKRAMAAEYSRELSIKVFESQMRLARLGFRQGAIAGYGYRRLLIDEDGVPRMLLRCGQLKRVHRDYVVLVPGPPEEADVVKTIYQLYLSEGYDRTQIARYLNARGIKNVNGNGWTANNVLEILTNEKYIGNLVYNRTSIKMLSKRVYNHRDEWVRVRNAFAPLIDEQSFEKARRRLEFSSRRSTNELLDHLTCVLCVKGYLTPKVIDSVKESPCSTTYCDRFGKLAEAYRLIGYRIQHWRHRVMLGDPAFNKLLRQP